MLSKLKKPATLRIFTGLFAVVVLAYASSGFDVSLIEELSIASGVSWDIEEKADLTYRQGILVYGESQRDARGTDYIFTTESLTPSSVREVRNIYVNKKFQSGFVRIYLIGEPLANLSIKSIVDLLLYTSQINNKVYFSISKGEAYNILNIKEEKNFNIAEYIEGLIKSAPDYNFFSDKFTLIDVLMNTETEGKNLVLPYIQRTDQGVLLSGLALFKGTKMIGSTNIQEAKYLNLMRNKKGKGMISVKKSAEEYIDFLGNSKRKIKCIKENGKYKFTIEITLKGEIVSNELYKNLLRDPGEIKKVQKELAAEVTKECTRYIEKMKKQYKTDVLNLGSVAAAEYGRGTGVDWNEIVSESNIDVKVKVKVGKQGRGDF